MIPSVPLWALNVQKQCPGPEIADLIRAAYDPVMPAVATDASHALRLSARVQPPS